VVLECWFLELLTGSTHHADQAEIRVAEWVTSGRIGWTHVRGRADVRKFFGFIG
jgi:hypothetical protein